MDTFFSEKRPWSYLKHDILKVVLEHKLFSGGDASFTYIDGLAGAGAYEDGEQAGPLIALDIFRDMLDQRPDSNAYIDAVFIELNPETCSTLEVNLLVNSLEDERLHIHTKCADFNQILDDALTISGDRGLVFVDPYGLKPLSDESIEKIRGLNRKLDVMINFNIGAFRRVTGQGKVFEGSQKTLEQATGVEYDEDPASYFKQYVERLLERYQGVNFIPLKTKNIELFYMLLCTNDINLYSRFNDFANGLNDFDTTLLQPEAAVYDALPLDEAISQKNLMFSIFNSNFGFYKAKKYTEVLRKLLDGHKICMKPSYNSRQESYDCKGLTTRINGNMFFQRK
jgi:three-Cys-motif partner protein